MDASVRKLVEAEGAFRQGDLARAGRLLKQVLLAAPANSRANELMAYVEGERGNLEAVFTHLDKATRASGASPTAWYYLGVWYRRNGRLAEALTAFQEALRRDPGLFAAAHDLGLSLFDLGDPAAALAAYDRALASNPASYELAHNRARALHALGRYEEALKSFDEALALRPESVPTLLDRGETCNELGRHAEALENFASAARQSPDNADAQWSEALARLLLGQLEVGWPKYEARWRALNWTRRHVDIAAWPADRSTIGKRVLVWCEQGLGDTLHFCRYAPLLARRGAHVVLEVQPELKGLLSRLPGCEVYARGEALPDCDYQIPLLSLPQAFGTTLATIPAEVPYLRADPARMALWLPRIQSRSGRLRIGIACSGRAGTKDLRHRAMSLQDLLPLQDQADLFLIQTEVRPEDAECLRGSAIRSLAGDIVDFEDSAAIVEQLDLVVTVDTSLAHLAGALGRPVFILLPFVPTWRWLVDRADSPWYPTARLFRQQAPGDWSGVVSQVIAVLHNRA